MSSLLLLSLSSLSSFVITAEFCVFHDASSTTQTPLHLEWFPNNKMRLSRKDESQDFMYYYTPCLDNCACGSNEASTGQIEQSSPDNLCYIISKFDDTIQPTYNASAQKWTFFYKNGFSWQCGNGVQRAIYIHWHCNMNTTGNITKVFEPQHCVYQMDIDSKWACLGQIPPSTDSGKSEFWQHKQTLVVMIAVAAVAVLLLLLWCFLFCRRWYRRQRVKDLIKDIMDDDGDYELPTTNTDIDLNDNVSDISKLQHVYVRNTNYGMSKPPLLTARDTKFRRQEGH